MNWWIKLTNSRYMAEAGADGVADGEAPAGTDTPVEEDLVGDDLDFLFKDDDDEDPAPEPEKMEPEKAPEQDADKKPEETVPPVEEPEKKVEPEKKEEPEQKVEPEKKPEPEPEPEKKDEPEDLEAKRQEFLAEVEKSFAISEDDANMLITEPEKVLPRLAANIYDRAMSDVAKMFDTFSAQLPNMMGQVTAQTQAASDAEAQFLTANPGIEAIEATELKGLVEQFAPIITKQFPNASNEEKLKALGRTIAATKGINLTAAVPPVAKPKETPVKPHTPAAPVRSGSEFGKPQPATEEDAFISMLLDNQDD